MHEEQVGEPIADSAGNLIEHIASLGHLNRTALRSTMATRTANRFPNNLKNSKRPQSMLRISSPP